MTGWGVLRQEEIATGDETRVWPARPYHGFCIRGINLFLMLRERNGCKQAKIKDVM